MRTVLVTSADEFDTLAKPWDDLLSRSASNNVFLTWEWLCTWWHTYGRKGALRLVLAYDDSDRLCGIAPLYRTATYVGPVRFRTLEFLGARYVSSEYLDFIADRSDYARIVTALVAELRRRRDWDVLLGFHTLAESPTFEVLRDPSNAYAWSETLLTESLYVNAPDWATYFAQLGNSTRRNVRQYRKKAAEELHASVADTRQGIREQLRDLMALHQMRMQQLGFAGSFAPPQFVAFQERVAELFEQRGWSWMFSLRVDGKAIAANYGFLYNGSFNGYSMGFDPKYRDYSIGFVLFSYVLERCIASGFVADFLDPGRYKELWKPARRVKISYVVGSSGRSFAAYTKAMAARSFVVRTVKRIVPEKTVVQWGQWKDSLVARISRVF